MYAIETIKLRKYFTPGATSFFRKKPPLLIRAVDEVDMAIEKSKIFCLLGPNGAGKTTLVKTLCCLIMPDGGKALINGLDVIKNEPKIKPLIGLLTANERSFYWRLSGRQNLEFFATLYNLPAKKIEKKIDELADTLVIGEMDRLVQEYSTGARHKLALARSLIHDPEIIFMDEPTKSLDPTAAIHLRNVIKDLATKHKKTIFLTTHNTKEAESLADTIAIMHKGKIRFCGGLDAFAPKDLEEVFAKLTNE
ncbi:MAG: ABC transporter ATP-binding protein [Deltaproteobacteria bacterium]